MNYNPQRCLDRMRRNKGSTLHSLPQTIGTKAMKGKMFAPAEGEWYFESEEEEIEDINSRIPKSPFDLENQAVVEAGSPNASIEEEQEYDPQKALRKEGERLKDLTTPQIFEIFDKPQKLQELMDKCLSFPESMKRMFWRLHYLLGERIMDVQQYLIKECTLDGSLKLEVPDIEKIVCKLVEKALNEWEDEQFKEMKKNMQLLYKFNTWEKDIAIKFYNYCVRVWRKPIKFRLYLKYMSKDEREEVERLYALGIIDNNLLEKARALNILPTTATLQTFIQIKEAIKKAKIAADIIKNGTNRQQNSKEKEKIIAKHLFSVDRIPQGKINRVKPTKPWNYEYISDNSNSNHQPREQLKSISKPPLFKPSPSANKRPIHLNFQSAQPREINPLASASVGNSMVIIPGERVSKKILVIEEDDAEESPQQKNEGKKDWSRAEERKLCEIYSEVETLEDCMKEIDRQMSVDPRWRNAQLVEFKMRALSSRIFTRFQTMKSNQTNNNSGILGFKANRALVIGCTDPSIRHSIYRQMAVIYLCFTEKPVSRKKDISRAILEINKLCKQIHDQY